MLQCGRFGLPHSGPSTDSTGKGDRCASDLRRIRGGRRSQLRRGPAERGRNPGPNGRPAVSMSRLRLYGPGIFNSPAHIGSLGYGMTCAERHPETGRIRYAPQPEETWIATYVAGLRIIPQELWEEVRKRRDAGYLLCAGRGPRRRKPLTSLVMCAVCSQPMHMLGRERYHCSTLRKEGRAACPDARSAPVAQLEGALAELLLEQLRRELPNWEAAWRALRVDCERARHKQKAQFANLDQR